MNKKLTRINKLIEILKKKNVASVKELAAIFNLSEMTIRRDLEILIANNIISTYHGAAIYNQSNNILKFDNKYELNAEIIKKDDEKNRIGKFASTLIEPDDVIIIDTGSTTEKLAEYVPENLNITVLCYNINILGELKKKNGINLIFAGGYFHPNTEMFESAEGISLIQRTRANKVFVSAAGVHDKLGVTCIENYEVPTKSAIINSAIKKILLVDSSKFGTVRLALFAKLNQFDAIITDNKISEEWADYIEAQGITLYIV